MLSVCRSPPVVSFFAAVKVEPGGQKISGGFRSETARHPTHEFFPFFQKFENSVMHSEGHKGAQNGFCVLGWFLCVELPKSAHTGAHALRIDSRCLTARVNRHSDEVMCRTGVLSTVAGGVPETMDLYGRGRLKIDSDGMGVCWPY